MGMIDGLNVNDKVARVVIRISSSNQINEEIVEMMINRYRNVFGVYICDRSNSVNRRVHEKMVDLV